MSIPSIGIDEQLIDLGLQEDGSLEVPEDYGDVGWYTSGGRPGGPGPLVLAGHVDSTTGPAVFYRLGELEPGDTIEVLHDGGATSYEVTRIASHPKDEFPTVEVFGATASDELRLITCDGLFDEQAGSYLDNLVVHASAL